jgi:L-seryl-tRNA(Ser) seleniumtransferase
VDRAAREHLRRIPSIDRLLADSRIQELMESYGRTPVVEALRAVTGALRDGTLAGDGRVLTEAADPIAVVRDRAEERLALGARMSIRPAINATGVVLHTGLGRAVLSEAAARAVDAVARNHSLLEIDVETGERGSRQAHIRELLRELTGCEEALVVNNNASAVLLSIAAMAAGREVVIARGQLVEIGGSFRIPDVIRQSGARLVEVGATNKVRASDYETAITPEAALLLRVHPSNFRIVGFTEEVPLPEMVVMGRRLGLPVMDDLGSGALIDLTRYGLVAEPTVQESIRAGADVVTFSGDKLLGGPQCGLILGRKEALARMRNHPLMRVVRVDKMTVAALEATLRLYRDEPTALREIPTLRHLTVPREELQARAERIAEGLKGGQLTVSVEPGISQVGGGSLPGEELPTALVRVLPAEESAAELAQRLRRHDPPIFTRVRHDSVWIDVRTVSDEEAENIVQALMKRP